MKNFPNAKDSIDLVKRIPKIVYEVLSTEELMRIDK
jgi:hypothetical protein